MAHVNVTIPNRFSIIRTYRNRLSELEAKVKELNIELDEIYSILDNIPRAIEEFGYVELSDDNGNFLMTIIEKEQKENGNK